MGLWQIFCIISLEGLLTVGEGESPTCLPASRSLFLILGCLVQPQYEGFSLVLLYLVLSYLTSSLEGLLLGEEEKDGKQIWLRRYVIGCEAGRSRRRRNCCLEVLYEQRIHFQ